MDFLDKKFLDNTYLEWLITLAIIAGSIIVAKILYWFIKKVVKRLTAKTKTNLDDIIVDMVEEPLAFTLFVFGSWYGIGRLTFSEKGEEWINNVFYVILTYTSAWLINRTFSALVKEYLEPLVEKSEGDLDDQLLPVVKKVFKVTIWAFATIIALSNAGYDVTALIAGLGIGGLAFALAAQDSVSNLFGGFTIFADKPFAVNDRVKVEGYDGIIMDIGLRSTRLKTLEGRIVTIPNSAFTNNPIENVSSEPSRKVNMTLGLTYDMDDKKVAEAMEILKEVSADNSHIEDKVLISFKEFGDFSLNILYIYYIKKDADILDTQTEINMEILKKFNTKGLEFAFPSQTIYNKQLD